jgi:hypothetical protein
MTLAAGWARVAPVGYGRYTPGHDSHAVGGGRRFFRVVCGQLHEVRRVTVGSAEYDAVVAVQEAARRR